MLGVERHELIGGRAQSGAKSMTVCGAGNSSVPLMKQAGKAQGSPGLALLVGNGGKG